MSGAELVARCANLDARLLAAVRRRFGADATLRRQYVNGRGQTVSVWRHPAPAVEAAMRAAGLDVDADGAR